MSPANDPRRFILFLCEHLASFVELAVLVWLARNRNSYVSSIGVAEQVGIDEEQALKVLEYFVSIGLARECREFGLYRYALDSALPSGLVRGLGMHFASSRPN